MAEQLDLRRDLAQWPLQSFRMGKFGAYGAVRTKPSEGLCGPKPNESVPHSYEEEQRNIAARWPCTHYGADLAAPQGYVVQAPHDGWLLYCGPADKAPFIGYGPGVALIAHADAKDSWWARAKEWSHRWRFWDFPAEALAGRYSLIGHLDVTPGVVPRMVGQKSLPGDIWDTLSKEPNREHWQRGEDGLTVLMCDEAEGAAEDRRVHVGDILGAVSDARHIHWEIRTSPLAGHDGRFDPVSFMSGAYGLNIPDGVFVPPPAAAPKPDRAAQDRILDEPRRRREAAAAANKGGGSAGLLLLAALAFGKKRRRR